MSRNSRMMCEYISPMTTSALIAVPGDKRRVARCATNDTWCVMRYPNTILLYPACHISLPPCITMSQCDTLRIDFPHTLGSEVEKNVWEMHLEMEPCAYEAVHISPAVPCRCDKCVPAPS